MTPAETITGFNQEVFAEPMKGRPKTVRIESEEFRDDSGQQMAGKRYLVGIAEYRENEVEAWSFRPDGTLSYRSLYEYDAQQLRKVITFDGNGRTVQTEAIRSIAPGVNERISCGPGGVNRVSTITSRDQAGRLLESTVTAGHTQDQLLVEYDADERPVSGLVTSRALDSEGGEETNAVAERAGARLGWSIRIKFDYPADGERCMITLHGPDGTILGRTETNIGDLEQEASQLILGQQGTGSSLRITRIDSRDLEGNWTCKTTLERNPATQAIEAVVTVHRTITY